ncbi:LOW QUALITY PROTEIN: scale keratin-like [Anomalospiza imberbis]|uniref:LOW QUALITY PROTEIN: scale keratin-like n=1 Tax=Anomalospiza imberbis TaxID=187417 RepID=UPI00358E0DA0
MSCYDLYPSSACGVIRPQPLADSGNEPCVRQCPDSTTVIQPPPVVVTLPGPILSSFPQDSVVGSAGAPVLPASGASLGYGGLYGYGGYGPLGYGGLWGYGGYGPLGYGGLWGYGGLGYCGGYRGLYGFGRSFGSCSPYSSWYGRYRRGSCGPC